jgi:HAE1 family hydrophobic/amphiphilic exporter-1
MTRLLFILIAIALPAGAQPPVAPAPAGYDEKSREEVLRAQRVGVGSDERRMTLDDAIQMALKNNLEIDIERLGIDTARSSTKLARGVFDPVVLWTPSYAKRNNPTANSLFAADGKIVESEANVNFGFKQRTSFQGLGYTVDFTNQRLTTNNPFTALNPSVTPRLTFGLTLPLWRYRETDNERAQLRIRQKQEIQSRADFETRAIDVITRAESAYWDLAAAIEDAVVAEYGVRLAREQHERNQRQVNAGTLAPVELSASEAELQRRIDTYVSAIGVITIAENQLKTLLLSSNTDPLWSVRFTPVDRRPADAKVTDLLEATNLALKQRPELRSLASRVEQNEEQKRLAASAGKPQLNVVAGYSNTGLAGTALPSAGGGFLTAFQPLFSRVNELSALAGLPPLPPPSTGGGVPPAFIGGYGTALSNMFSGNYQSVVAGVTIEWNPRNRAAEASYEQSVINEKRLQLSRRQLEQFITAEVRGALQALETARQRIEAARASERAASEKLESEIRLFQTGESTNFLVLTRQNELLDSRRRVVGAALLYNKAVARLDQAIGATFQVRGITID